MSLHTGHDSVCSASWVRSNRDQFGTDDPDARLVEVDMEPEAYDEWHIPGAVHVDWESLPTRRSCSTVTGPTGLPPMSTGC